MFTRPYHLSDAKLACKKQATRNHVKEVPTVLLDLDAKVSLAACKMADDIFEDLKAASCFKNSKLLDKLFVLRRIVQAACEARHKRFWIRYSRANQPNYAIFLQVIDALVERGYFSENRSPKQSNKMSRLIPRDKLIAHLMDDGEGFSTEKAKPLVQIHARGTEPKEMVKFDKNHPTAVRVVKTLTQVNAVNAVQTITHEKFSDILNGFDGRNKVRPSCFAVFTDDFDHHGRIYTGNHGHQSLSGLERRTIRINGKSTVELDYSGLHVRMLYHLDGLEFKGDPYALWGNSPTSNARKDVLRWEHSRALAKIAVNAMINAASDQAAVSACNSAMCSFHHDAQGNKTSKKTGKGLAEARRLYDAWTCTNLKFVDVVALARKKHHLVEDHFGCDKGIELMNLDGKVCLDVLSHFAFQAIPILSCHDSFIVTKRHEEELRETMILVYQKHVGGIPVVKRS